MTEPGEREAAKARSLGLALLDASRIYEGFVIPSFEGGLRFPPHRRAIIGLAGRQRPRGLVLRGEPTAQFLAPPVYLHGAWLLYETLKNSGELTPALNLSELPSLGRDIEALVKEQATARMPPNWQDLLR